MYCKLVMPGDISVISMMLYLFINTVYYAARIVLNMDTYREHSYLYPKACGVDEYNDVHHLSVL